MKKYPVKIKCPICRSDFTVRIVKKKKIVECPYCSVEFTVELIKKKVFTVSYLVKENDSDVADETEVLIEPIVEEVK